MHPTPAQLDALRSSLQRTFFRGWSDDYFASPSFSTDMDAHAIVRYEECRDVILPWIESYMPLTGKRVIDFGCGTGASTAAWATKAKDVIGYDIHGPSIEAARERMHILGLDNVRVEHVGPADILPRMRTDVTRIAAGGGGVDAIVLYAVLEHQTISERIDTLRTCWESLTPGGLLVVGDSPSRFSLFDYHTSSLPFFQWMPDELCVRYAVKSPRAELREGVAATMKQGGLPAAIEFVQRSGRGVGHQEFELALGELRGTVVGDSFDECMVSHVNRRVTIEDEIAAFIASSLELRIPRGFLRPSLEVILRKPTSSSDLASPKPPPPLRGLMLKADPSAPSISGEARTTVRADGVRILNGEGAFVEYKLPHPASAIEIEILKHPWSGTLVVTADGREVAAEDLYAEAAKVTTLRVELASPSCTVRLGTRDNPRSQGQEAWIHAIRSC